MHLEDSTNLMMVTAVMLLGTPVDYVRLAAIVEHRSWVPKAGGLGIGLSILSYAGQVRLGVITDAGLVPGPEAIVAGIQAEFDAFLALAQQTRERPAAAALMDTLDDALAKVDSLLAKDVAKGPHAQGGALARCRALTKARRPCRNRALPGSDFCHVHELERHRP